MTPNPKSSSRSRPATARRLLVSAPTAREQGGPSCESWTRAAPATLSATTPDAIARLLAKHGLGPRPLPKQAPLGQLRLAFPKA